MSEQNATPPGWYHAAGDPPATQRYWDGNTWQGGPQPVSDSAPDYGANPAGNFADQGKRILARLIDFAVWILISVVVNVVFGISVFSVDGGVSGSAIIASLLALVLTIAYEAALVGSTGQTLGKMALGIRVARLDGQPNDLSTGLKRAALYAITIVPLLGIIGAIIVGLVSLVFLFTDAQRQAVWDKLAGTVVVDA